MKVQTIRAKINDVAELAGVSIKTVSRVLNNEPNVRADTRKKVKSAVRELNYKPSISARSLAGKRSYMLAMFYDTASESYLSRFQKAALNACRQANYHLIVEQCSISDAATADRLVETATQLGVDGVLLLPPVGDTQAIVTRFAEQKISTALIAPGGNTHGMPSVRMDDQAAGKDVTRYLVEKGHRRIGFIRGHPDHGAAQLRFQGYMAGLADAGIDIDSLLIISGDFTFGSGIRAARELLERDHRPSAIFASNDEMAAATMRVALEAGLNIPADLSVVGFDDAQISRATVPALTTVRQPVEDMATAAIERLLAAHSRGEELRADPVFDTLFEYKLVERSSVGRGPYLKSEGVDD